MLHCTVLEFLRLKMPYNDKKKIIFLHIPKTGGTTIERLFNINLFHSSRSDERPSLQHLTCNMLCEKMGKSKYDSYYKFTFIRNPWARILSTYFWRQTLPKKRPILPFNDFINVVSDTVENNSYYEQEFGDHFIPQIEYTTGVDDIYKYENFSSEINTISSKLNIPISRIPSKNLKHYDHYWDFYDVRNRNIINNLYHEEIERFGYKFGS